MSGRETVLRAEGLSYRYGKTEVFGGASLALRAGEVAFLTGPNGRGSRRAALPGRLGRARRGASSCAARASTALSRAAKPAGVRARRPLVLRRPYSGRAYPLRAAGEPYDADDDPSERLMASLRPRRPSRPAALGVLARHASETGARAGARPRAALAAARRTVRAARPGRLRGVERAGRGSRSAGAACSRDAPNLRPDALLRLKTAASPCSMRVTEAKDAWCGTRSARASEATMHDVRLLLWLRARHARSALNRTLHLVGAGVDDGGWGERATSCTRWASCSCGLAMAAALVDAIQGSSALSRRRMLARGSGGAARGGARPAARRHRGRAHDAVEAVASRHSLSGGQRGERAGARGRVGRSASFRRRGCRGGAGFCWAWGWRASVLAGAPAAVALAGAALAAAAVALGWVVGFVRLASDGWSGWRTAAAAFVLVAFAALVRRQAGRGR